MQVTCVSLVTKEKLTFSSLKECCKHFSIPEEYLQVDYTHPKFKDGIFQKYSYTWYRITVYETLENCLSLLVKPIQTLFYTKYKTIET